MYSREEYCVILIHLSFRLYRYYINIILIVIVYGSFGVALCSTQFHYRDPIHCDSPTRVRYHKQNGTS